MGDAEARTTPAPSTDSLGKRFGSKLTTRFVGLGLGLVTVGIVPRALGPALYGDFGFLTHFFNQVDRFLSVGTRSAFYAKLSQRLHETALIGFYLTFVAGMVVLVYAGIALAYLAGIENSIWPGQRWEFVIAAAALALLTFVSGVVHQINDAYGFTYKSELVFMLQSVLSAALVLGLYLGGYLTLQTYFGLHLFLQFVAILGGWKVLASGGLRLRLYIRAGAAQFRGYAREFWTYAHPLVVHSLVVMVVAIGDRWLLQYFGGSAEQGFYSLSLKVSSLCFLFTSSVSGLFMRELAVSHGRDDKIGMRRLFERFVPLFYFVAAYFGIFVAVEAEAICLLIGGEEYLPAAMALAIMALYPLHQTYGHLSGSVLLVMAHTRAVRNITLLTAPFGLALTYLLLASSQSSGLDLGSIGLAGKMVAVQLVAVNIQLILNARQLGFSFGWFLGNQFLTPSVLLMAALAARQMSRILSADLLPQVLVAGMLYSIIAAAIVWNFPGIAGATRGELKRSLSLVAS